MALPLISWLFGEKWCILFRGPSFWSAKAAMGRKSAPAQDFMPVPTEAVQIPEVPVSTEDLFATRPRTKKDWMKKARTSKSSKGAPAKTKPRAKVPAVPSMDDMPAPAPTQKLSEEVPATQLAEDTLVPTQKLEEPLPPTQQLAEEETSPPSSLVELSPTQPAAAQVYGRCKRRRTKSCVHPGEGSSKPELRSMGGSLPRKSSMSGMTFHDFVEMGRQIHQRESGETAALPSTLKEGTSLDVEAADDAPANLKDDEDQPAPTQRLAEDILPPTQKLIVDFEDEPLATEKLDASEEVPVATEKLEAEQKEETDETDLHEVLQRHIFELGEVATEMTHRQKALVGVYKALKAFL